MMLWSRRVESNHLALGQCVYSAPCLSGHTPSGHFFYTEERRFNQPFSLRAGDGSRTHFFRITRAALLHRSFTSRVRPVVGLQPTRSCPSGRDRDVRIVLVLMALTPSCLATCEGIEPSTIRLTVGRCTSQLTGQNLENEDKTPHGSDVRG